MRMLRILVGLALCIGLVAGGLGLARGVGWHLSITDLDDAWTYPEAGPAHSLSSYDISNETLTAGSPARATITLLSENEIILSLRQLHRGVCQRLQRTFAADLAQAPYRETALFGLFERQTPIEITLSRSKNQFNPFMLLALMSHQTEDSIDPFVTKRPVVEEVFTMTERRQCGKDTKKPALMWRVLDFFNG